MTKTEEKLPSKEGLKTARERLKKIYRKPPTEDLVKIISEIGKDEESGRSDSGDDIAALPDRTSQREVEQ